ncbi:hypothetical protein FRB94_006226 [Tulasnella sp. JGI-2019a]|nr:hypothetical protein FRB93_006671 [Tulasnella sp. JGI-2019a]KAG8999328.1 hypothetical protein FRB94_006226 [Tulasnella sp. JGI-2019a]
MNSPLHVHYHNNNQRGFKQVLDAARSSTSPSASGAGPGMSPSSPGPRSRRDSHYGQLQAQHMNNASDIVNARDSMGRTVLHLVCSSTDPGSLPYLQMLLAHPLVKVNTQDVESHWTPLHRALWAGNIHAAVALARQTDIDLRLKDWDGYTPFDLYNESVKGTAPTIARGAGKGLYIWGQNRHSLLGFGDDSDRLYPDQVDLTPAISETDDQTTLTRLDPLTFEGIAMARLHTIVITSEPEGNLRACGSGSSGRLGPGTLHHTQNHLVPLPHVANLTIVSVSLGQDHTLALTSDGEVYSWGFNRFHQLGYAVEAYVKDGKVVGDDTTQPTARRVLGVLRSERVKGIAACKIASACCTEHDVFTWGTNRGQLGYSKTTQPIQVTPRKVTPITLPVLSVVMSDSALCILLSSKEVICFANSTNFKINFPAQLFPNDIQPWFRPSKALVGRYRTMEKMTCSEDTFAGVSSSGDVFTWVVSSGDTTSSTQSGGTSGASGGTNYSSLVRPQRIWTSDKQFNAAKDVALGQDGTAILCTQSGHAYIRSRTVKTSGSQSTSVSMAPAALNKPFKFHRVPLINRVVGVAASPAGAFAAMRMDAMPPEIVPNGPTIEHDISQLLPFLRVAAVSDVNVNMNEVVQDDEDDPSSAFSDVAVIQSICDYIRKSIVAAASSEPVAAMPYAYPALDETRAASSASSHGADVLVSTPTVTVPLHSSILTARSGCLQDLLASQGTVGEGVIKISFTRVTQAAAEVYGTRGRLSFSGCHSLSLLLLIQYIYNDDIAAVWDRQIGSATEHFWRNLQVTPAEVLTEIKQLSKILRLQNLAKSLQGMYKVRPAPRLVEDVSGMFNTAQNTITAPSLGGYDIVIQLADRPVNCHSTVLRVRSPFFSALFGDSAWTSRRWNTDGILLVAMPHLQWKHMHHVFQHIYCGVEGDIFNGTDSLRTVDDLLDHAFLVMAAANELLLDKLVLTCSRIIFRHVTISNVCSLLRDATTLHATRLVEALRHYMVMNMELLIEGEYLEELSSDVLKDFSGYTRTHQTNKYPITRSGTLVSNATSRWAEWLALQDIPPQYYTRKNLTKPSPKLAPVDTSPMKLQRIPSSDPISAPPGPTPGIASAQLPGNEGTVLENGSLLSTSPSAPWKGKGVAHSIEKSDLRAIMESEREKMPSTPSRVVGFSIPGSSPSTSEVPRWTPKASSIEKRKSQQSLELTPSVTPIEKTSPWKVLPKATVSMVSINAEAALERSNATQPPPSPSPQPPSGLAKALSAHKPQSSRPTPAQSSSSQVPALGLGPVITPIRSVSTGSVPVTKKKKGLGSDAWTLPPPPPPARAPCGSSASILDIQQQEQEELESVKVKKTLREIQEEEEERRVQEDFERWWAMEEERVKAEEEAMLTAAKAISSASGQMATIRGGRPGRGRSKKRTSALGGRATNPTPAFVANPDTALGPVQKTLAMPIGVPGAPQERGGRRRNQN